MFKKIWSKIKSISYDWLPLSGMVAIIYMLQRGFAALSKAGVAGVDLSAGLSIYFYVVALAALVVGLLADRIKPWMLIAGMTLLGTIGLVGAGNPWVFGICCGLAASSVKILPFSIPLKNKDSKVEALRVAPQASAKNIGAGIFTALLAGSLVTIGFGSFLGIMGGVFALCGVWTLFAIRKHRIKLLKWNMGETLGLLKEWKWWLYAAWYILAGVFLYSIVRQLIPGLMTLGMSKAEAAAIFGSLSVATCTFRWGAAWLGDKLGHFKTMLIGTVGQIATYLILPVMPVVGLGLYFAAFSISTPNMWACAKEWFGARLGTAMGMVFVVCYLAMGFLFGTWTK